MNSYISCSQSPLPRPIKVSYTQPRQSLETDKPIVGDIVQFSGTHRKSEQTSGKREHNKLKRRLRIAAMVLAVPTAPLVALDAWAEATAQVSPNALYWGHYVARDSKPVGINFAELDLSGIQNSKTFPNLQEIAEGMNEKGQKSLPIDYTFGYHLHNGDYFSVGGINVNLKGEMTIKNSHWELKNGELTGEPNTFQFHPEHSRSTIGNIANWMGGLIPGVPFKMVFNGEQPYHASGKLDLNTAEAPKFNTNQLLCSVPSLA